ncbi:DUF2782 domain-containing protein [Pseudomonadota bacterium]
MNRIFLLPLAAIALFAATITTSQAEDGVMPPPTDVHDTHSARETIDTGSEDTDLNEELSAPEEVEGGAEVRSFMRKDGAEVTEYSLKGKVYMVRVQPTGNFPAYYLYDSDGDGLFEKRLPGGYKRPSPPMWIIKKF